MNKKSIIMLVANYPATYGHTTVINNFAQELKKLKFRVAIGAFKFFSEPPEGIEKVVINKTKLFLHGTTYLDFDIIHFHQTQLMYYILNSKPTKPIIFHYHGASDSIQRQNFKLAMNLYRKKITKIISVSQAGITQMKQLVPSITAKVIYNGVDNKFFNSNNDKITKIGSPQLLFVGGLRKYKQIDILIHAVRTMIKSFPDLHLQIIGDGEEFRNLQRTINTMKLNEHIQLIGEVNRNQLKNYYKSCDVYISASSFEVCPVPPIEAMSCGKPLLLYNVEPHQELIENSSAGILFNELTPEEILSKLRNLLKEQNQLSQNAKNYAIKNDWSELTNQLVSLYEKL
tara:strand:- start:1349 stop:2377 length:1029 start_codon:yes stop_codon:yes gene_type:complete